MIATVNYVGAGTRRLSIRSYQNTAPTPGPGHPQARAPYPYIRPTSYDWDAGTSNYQALQVLLDKKYANGLAVMASYTWSKVIDIGCSGFLGAACFVQDPYHFNTSRGVAGFDLTHNMAINWVYELPFGGKRRFRLGNGVANYLVGGWQANGIAILRSGLPYTLTVAGDIANIGAASGYMRPNMIADPTLANPSPTRWFNQSAFSAPPIYTFGNLGRNTFRSDWTRNFDLSVFREFRLMEHRQLEFRTESFNTFNTPTFAAPTASLSSPTFGQVLSTANRARQFAV